MDAFLHRGCVTGLSYSWQGAGEQMVAAAMSGGARRAVEEESPVFIKLMNVWSNFAAPRRVI